MNKNELMIYTNIAKHKTRTLPLKFKVVAVAVTKKGNVLGLSTNGFRLGLSNRKGAGIHAERELIKKYGQKIGKIYIWRYGNNGKNELPIDPCVNCQKIAKKLNIKIISMT
jgi:cytidine deaminase